MYVTSIVSNVLQTDCIGFGKVAHLSFLCPSGFHSQLAPKAALVKPRLPAGAVAGLGRPRAKMMQFLGNIAGNRFWDGDNISNQATCSMLK